MSLKNLSISQNGRVTLTALTSLGLFLLLLLVFLVTTISHAETQPELDNFNYLPLVEKPLPPTPTPPAPLATLTIPLPDAMCPNDIAINETSGYVYVANSYSDDVSVIHNDALVANVYIGRLPTDVAPIPNSSRTYITHLTDINGVNQIPIFEQATIVNRAPDYFEPHDIIYNPSNGYVYVTDLNSRVRVLNGTAVVADILLPNAGWVRSIEVDPQTGLVYAASWERGLIYVIQDTTILTQFQAGWGTMEISIEPNSGYFYLAHSDPNKTYAQNISVFHRDDYTVTPIKTAVRSQDVATDPVHGLAYATNPNDNTVTILKERSVMATVPVGQDPRPVAVDPTVGYAYVGNHGSNSITIFNNGTIIDTEPSGRQPYAITVDSRTHDVYVANRTWRIVCDGLGRCNPRCDEFTPTITVLR